MYFSKNKLVLFNFLILLLSILWLKEINYLFYDTLESPDINKYFIYFDHFFNNLTTYKEHGLMYYYLHSLNYSIFYSEFQNFDLFVHKSIQQVNFYIFIFGIIEYFYLLRFLNNGQEEVSLFGNIFGLFSTLGFLLMSLKKLCLLYF